MSDLYPSWFQGGKAHFISFLAGGPRKELWKKAWQNTSHPGRGGRGLEKLIRNKGTKKMDVAQTALTLTSWDFHW